MLSYRQGPDEANGVEISWGQIISEGSFIDRVAVAVMLGALLLAVDTVGMVDMLDLVDLHVLLGVLWREFRHCNDRVLDV